MKPHLIAALLAALAAGGLVRAEIVERIAVSVGNQVITAREIARDARLSAFLNNRPPDFTPAARRKTADRLVEQLLVRRDLESASYPAPEPAEIEPGLADIRRRYASATAFQADLTRAGISERELRDYLLWQLTFLRFIETRFRPGVLVTDEEVREYFEHTVEPAAARANPGRTPELADYRERIEQTLAGERVDQEVDRWLQAARRRNRVEYREEAFQ